MTLLPGAIIINSLKMYDITALINPHPSFAGRTRPPVRRELYLAFMVRRCRLAPSNPR
jgi:hypothetical protein